MKRHLTEKELIQYQFKLISDVRREEIAGHLQDCVWCRERLEQLQRKFAALDLLREETKVSDDLISRVISQAKQRPKYLALPFRRGFPWISAAAAMLLAGSLLLVVHLNKQARPRPEVARGPEPTAEKITSAERREKTSAVDLDKKDALETTFALAAPKKKEAEAMDDGRRTTDESSLVPIADRPPFAPASAIELVVLPRREKVQLTIYNSTFQAPVVRYDGYGVSSGRYGVSISSEREEPARRAMERAKMRRDVRETTGDVQKSGLTLVRERRNLTLKRGWNWLQFMWANTLIDPTSLSLEPLQQKDKIDVQQLVFPARLRELGRWLIHSEVSGQVPFEITYFTSGLSWRAFYMGTLSQDEKTMQLQGYVRVTNNSGEDYENAQTRLIVGKVHILDQIAQLAKRRYPYDRPVMEALDEKRRLLDMDMIESRKLAGYGGYGGYGVGGLYFDELRPKEIIKEGLSEYFLYTIEGTETIPDKWGKRLLSFEAEDIPVKSLYKYDEERWGQQAIRFVSFANDEEHNLGDTPIPDGSIKIYSQADEQGYLSYVGGTDIKYIPVNEEIELNLGPARLVSVEPVLMNYKKDNFVFDRRRNITGWDEIQTWKIKITNTRTLPIAIEITRRIDAPYWTLQPCISYEKYDARHVRFKVNLEPRSKRTFEYTVRIYHGERKEVLAKNKF
ncbi:MAG: DUF4139 domain-containing protein [Sedimentisphaerales bacterium]